MSSSLNSLYKYAVYLAAIIIVLLLPDITRAQQPYLSNLRATADDPIYSTYAAPMQRSQFIVDEGYHLNYYTGESGIDLETDKAGDWGLAFKMDGRVRYLRSSMFAEPVITASYSDLVKYHYQPFDGIEVEVFFDVYSSRMAIQDVRVTNNTGSPVELDVYPFINHTRGLDSVAVAEDRSYLTFRHNEPVDGWTISHDVPHQAELRNVFMVSDSADAVGAYASMGTPPQSLQAKSTVNDGTDQIQLPSSNYAVEYGTVSHADGSACNHAPPKAQQIITLNASDDEILTEQAPKWGDADPNVPGNGWQGAELGNFQPPELQVGDTFEVVFVCNATGQVGMGSGEITELPDGNGIRTDIQLNDVNQPSTPANLEVDFAQGGTSASLTWEGDTSDRFEIYRRTVEVQGHYNKITEVSGQTSYFDNSIQPDSSYTYVVISYNDQDIPGGHSNEAGSGASTVFFSDLQEERLAGIGDSQETRQTVALQHHWQLDLGETRQFRIVRAVAAPQKSAGDLAAEAAELLDVNLNQVLADAEQTYSRIPDLNFDDPHKKMLYWNAFSLIRQNMMPPEGLTSNNYYVFSREPTWGWGHGGQVFHESLVMLAYVFMDPASARGSQRVYMERQHDNGYIDYRSGPYLEERIPTGGQLTTSAPWYNWENWEIYNQDPNESFLRDAYASGKSFYNFWFNNRDADDDGLCEWGAHAVLECVRDGQVAVWDQVGWPSNFEAMDLNVMLVREARSLARMADALGDTAAARDWRREAADLSERIRNTFWDDETGFFYLVDRDDHDFTYEQTNDLKRKEVIGFLPLWAEVASGEQAEQLVQHLTDEDKFWREYGVPSLSADDPYYNDKGYWNGPVWVQWDYLIFDGLRRYGYHDEANELADKVYRAVIEGLQRDHTFWEFYSPDDSWGGYHQAYIWTGIVARMLLDQNDVPVTVEREKTLEKPDRYRLDANYPNPFNPSTTIQYELPERTDVQLTIFDATGRRVASLVNREQAAGRHRVTFEGENLSSGIYFYRLETSNWRETRKMLLVK